MLRQWHLSFLSCRRDTTEWPNHKWIKASLHDSTSTVTSVNKTSDRNYRTKLLPCCRPQWVIGFRNKASTSIGPIAQEGKRKGVKREVEGKRRGKEAERGEGEREDEGEEGRKEKQTLCASRWKNTPSIGSPRELERRTMKLLNFSCQYSGCTELRAHAELHHECTHSQARTRKPYVLCPAVLEQGAQGWENL